MDYTTADLIQLVKERETIPDSGVAYSDDVLLRYLDQALKGFIVPAIEATLEEHFVVTHDIEVPAFQVSPVTTPPTDVPNAFEIPSLATGLRLRDVYILANDGSFFNLPRLTPTQAASMQVGVAGPSTTTWFSGVGQFYGGFYLQGNTVQVFPYGLASGKTFRLTFQRAPADLCLVEDAGLVLNVTGDVVTVDKVLPWYSGVTRVGVVSGLEPHDYARNAAVPTPVYASYAPLDNVLLTTVAGNVITLPAGVGASVTAGDWLCPLRQSVYCQNIPREVLPALVQKAAEMCLHSAGDAEGTAIANKEFNAMLGNVLRLIAPRVIGKPVKAISLNSVFKASRAGKLGRW